MAELQDILPFTKKLTLLYIDTDETTKAAVVPSLQKIFSRVELAADGYNGLNHFKINQNDIVIMDCKIPNMTGVMLAKNIKEARPDQPVIVTCDEVNPELLFEMVNVGIEALVKKPFTIEELLPHIQRCAKIAYQKQKSVDMLARVNTLKEQHEQRIDELLEREKKGKEDLAYERKRLGRLLGQQKEMEKELNAAKEKIASIRMISDTIGIPSRHALQSALAKEGEKGLLYINIDNFDLINSIYGMAYGNKVLKEAAVRIDKFLPSNAVLFHITADEFAILLLNPTSGQEKMLADQIQALFKESSLQVEGHTFTLSFSIGFDRGVNAKLFVQSKTASKEARYNGGGQTVAFNPQSAYIEMQRNNLHWIRVITEALNDDRIETYYQPIRCNRDNSTEQYEVLCRIATKEGTIINAEEFIQPAAIGGLLTKITRVVIDRSFKFFAHNAYPFSINIGREDLLEEYLEDFLAYKCERYGIDPTRVSLEFLEDSTRTDAAAVIGQIQRLREAGYHVAVDDFGAEYAVFSRMLRLHADYIKIDSVYIQDIPTNQANRLIVENIVTFAKKAGIKTVAEHVDSAEVQEVVNELGIDYSQGYYIGKPAASLG